MVRLRLADLPRGRTPNQLEVTLQRWSCRNGCPQPAPEPESGLRAPTIKGRRPEMTTRLLDVLLDRYLAGETAAHLARWCGLSERGVRDLLNDLVDERLQAPRDRSQFRGVTHVGIDEVFWGGRVLCTILDLRTGKLLELLPDRQPSTVQAFLLDLNTLRQGLPPPVFVTDMWAEYRQVLRLVYGSDLAHVVDRFHIQVKISEDLNEVVRMILPATSFRPRQIRKVQQVLIRRLQGQETDLSGVEGLTERQQHELEFALTLAMDLHAVWRRQNEVEAAEQLRRWEWQRAVFEYRLGERQQPFARLAYLIREWRSEILAYFTAAYHLPDGTRPTTGRLEAVNGVIRRFLLTSRHPRRKPFAEVPEQWAEQRQFDRLWLRLMHRVNHKAEKPVPVVECCRPDLKPCQCGASPRTCSVTWEQRGVTWDRPLGFTPVKIVHEMARLECSQCGRRWQVTGERFGKVTSELADDLVAWRKEGHSLRTLYQWTGVSTARIKQITSSALPVPHIYFPDLIGVQRWTWRKRDHWVITDPRRGRLIDLLQVADDDGDWVQHAEVLRNWVEKAARRGTYRVLVGSLEWNEDYPSQNATSPLASLTVLADRFTTITLVHQALREVTWRYQQSLSVTARRSPERRRTRFLLLANACQNRYRRLDDRMNQGNLHARREALLASQPVLSLASGLLEQLRRVTQLDENDDLTGMLTNWIDEVMALPLPDHPDPLERSLYFAFRNAAKKLRHHQESVVQGLELQAAEQISLASSRRLIRSLNEFGASKQPDFEYLRRSALHVFGAPSL